MGNSSNTEYENLLDKSIKEAVNSWIDTDYPDEYKVAGYTRNELQDCYERVSKTYPDNFYEEAIGCIVDDILSMQMKTLKIAMDMFVIFVDKSNGRSENAIDFLNFIKQEIPEIYEQVKANYEKQKGANAK